MQTPSIKKSRFTEMLIEENALAQGGFEAWVFCHGMQFNSPDKWWGDRGLRDFPHEGIDLCLYLDAGRRVRRLGETTRIPVMHDGTVKALFKDYLGQAVIIEHECPGCDGGRFVSMYAHTNPFAGIDVGAAVKQGDIIATLADTRNAKADIIPHLHFSLAIPSSALSFERFVWNVVRRPEMMALQDPIPVLDRPHRNLEAGQPACREL
jgi:murein DD-endopeptidase MepM/ murein hydrolase activator NlpD